MPELPEVETVANGLNKRIAGDVFESVWIGNKSNLLKSPADQIIQTLEGSKVSRVRRVGKHIVADLSANKGEVKQWIIHLGMTGKVLVCNPQDEIAKHTHLIAKMKSGREVRFVDPRRFGKLAVVRDNAFTGPGQEPLDISFEDFAALFKGRKLAIKAALLNQSLLHGVGNIYADESLFRAGIRPTRPAGKVKREELKKLHQSLQKVLKEAIKAGGSSVSDYVDSSGEEGFFQLKLRVYQRTGEPCLKCKTQGLKTRIKRIVVGGRSTHYCPRCQR